MRSKVPKGLRGVMSIKDNPREMLSILFVLKVYGRLGRYTVSRLTGLSEGKVRRILKDLAGRGYVDVSKGGSKLTENGLSFYLNYLNNLGLKEICLIRVKDKVGVCVHLKPKNKKFGVLELRDEVVRGGAEGALILEVEKGELMLHPVGRMRDHLPEVASHLSKSLELRDGDLIIVGFGRELKGALKGAISTATKISNESTSTLSYPHP